jgi:hypothetical protein
MDKLLNKVKRVLKREFPGARLSLDAGATVGGEVIWDGFNRMPTRERVDLVFRVLKESLPPEAHGRIGGFLTFTPKEDAIMREEAARS